MVESLGVLTVRTWPTEARRGPPAGAIRHLRLASTTTILGTARRCTSPRRPEVVERGLLWPTDFQLRLAEQSSRTPLWLSVEGIGSLRQVERTWRGCVFIGVSLDGYIARTDGDLSWLTDPSPRPHRAGRSDAPATVWETFFPDVDTLVTGRKTYETVLGFGEWPFEGKRVIVLTTTLPEGDGRVTPARSVEDACALLTAAGARKVYVDGGRTIRSFLSAGLIDEITVSIAPVLIGSGVRLFGELDRDVLLTLRGTHATAEDGLVRITYDVVPGGSAARSRGLVDGPAEVPSL